MKVFTFWMEETDSEYTNELLSQIALMHASKVSLPSKELVTHYIRTGDIASLCDFHLDYESTSTEDALHLRQIIAFFEKRSDVDLGFDKRENAWSKWLSSESLCRETNEIFSKHRAGNFQFHPRVEAVLHGAQRKIAKILGPVPSLSDIHFRFGKGATTQIAKRNANSRSKLSGGFQCSDSLLPIVDQVLSECPNWAGLTFDGGESSIVPVTIENERLDFVPKNAKTDRAISVQPVLDGFCQNGIGDFLRARLAAFGVDLTDQTRNQRLAQYGSFTGELATLDLSSASDTIATELVASLLPIDWFLFLDRFRSRKVEYRGDVIKLQKFSAMGNGFTFPLETLIFYALAASCCPKTDYWVSVYGDDIIVPSSAYPLLCETLHAVGFIPNAKKSFASGPFRESCGADYLRGIDVRPCYIKNRLSGKDLFRLYNSYIRRDLPEFAALVLTYIDKGLRLWGPDGYGDGHLISDQWTRQPHRRHDGYGGYIFETYIQKPVRKFKASRPGDWVLPSYSIYLAPSAQAEECDDDRYDARIRSQDSESRFIYDKKGRLGEQLPGVEGCRRIKIYTLNA